MTPSHKIAGPDTTPMALPAPDATLMFREAAEAPAVVRTQLTTNRSSMSTIASLLRSVRPRAVVTCARGSSSHAATYARYLIETRLGILTAPAALSVSSVYGATPDLGGCLFLTISQSGRSPDLLAAARAAKAAGAFVLAYVNSPRCALGAVADYTIPLCAGPEHGVAATKSYIASLASIAQLVALWTEDEAFLRDLERADELLAQAWHLDWRAALPLLTQVRSLYVVSRGLGFGVAQEVALKCKETCNLHAEAFSAAELRHGPQALLADDFPALLLVQRDETRPFAASLARDLAARHVIVVAAGLDLPGVTNLPTVSAHPAVEPMLLAQASYRLLSELAVARGHDPDRPRHLTKITETV